jgi:2-iminobutanoate/2-iminopropanoate deaminase
MLPAKQRQRSDLHLQKNTLARGELLMRRFVLGIWLLAASTAQAQVHGVEPTNNAISKNPSRSPAVDDGDYVYVSAVSADRPDSTLPTGFAEQARQALENLKTVLSAAGLTMDHVVYLQVYLIDVSDYSSLRVALRKYFPTVSLAGAVLGVAKLPRGSIQVTAVAVRDISGRRVVSLPNYKSDELFSAGILTHDRLFVSAMPGKDLATGKIPEDPATQTDLALDGLNAVVDAAGLTMNNFVFINPFLTQKIPSRIMNEHYARRFEFGNTPARATISVVSLPENTQIEYTGVAVRDLKLRRAIRPRNMAPSPTASPCVFAGDTLYCSAKSGFIPGPNSGVYASTTGTQLRQTMRNQLDNLEEADLNFNDVVSTTIYLDDLSDTDDFNKVYLEYFHDRLPAQTVVQQLPPSNRTTDSEGRAPDLEQMSLIAVKHHPKN